MYQEVLTIDFIKGFINKYLQINNCDNFEKKDTLKFILCKSQKEVDNYISKEIDSVENKVLEIGFEELSISYQQNEIGSYDSTEQFSQYFMCAYGTLTFVTRLYSDFNKEFNQMRNKESHFWACFSDVRQNSQDKLNDLLKLELKLRFLISVDIETWEENGGIWNIELSSYEQYVNTNKYLKDLFNLCELLLLLNRLKYLNNLNRKQVFTNSRIKKGFEKDSEQQNHCTIEGKFPNEISKKHKITVDRCLSIALEIIDNWEKEHENKVASTADFARWIDKKYRIIHKDHFVKYVTIRDYLFRENNPLNELRIKNISKFSE
ncbi:MAG: hypothetical protein J0L62_08335 [Bacteroidetes bacterium]|nr:hypothetical protein [Bacteroidota bacterium]